MSCTDTRSRCAPSLATSLRTPLFRRYSLWIGSLAFLATAFLTTLIPMVASAVDEGNGLITRVEEDWQIDIGTPNPDENAPEITTVISPRGDLKKEYAVFELNNATQPSFEKGGLQLQCWYHEYHIYSSHHLNNTSLQIPNETINYTMTMSLNDASGLNFEIENGSSQSWGPFGKGLGGSLKLSWPTNLSNLNQYNPQTSVDSSRVGFASQRVKKVALKAVRYYSGGTLVRTDSTPRVVWEHSSGE